MHTKQKKIPHKSEVRKVPPYPWSTGPNGTEQRRRALRLLPLAVLPDCALKIRLIT